MRDSIVLLMDERERDLRALAEECTDRPGVADAWVAKSFTDLLFVVEGPAGASLPDGLREELAAHDLVGYNEAYDVPAPDPAMAGDLPDRDRYRFVDIASRGTQQSYVVE